MSKFQEIVDWLKDDPDVDFMIKDLGGELLREEVVENKRWSYLNEYFFRIGDEYFIAIDEIPATEMQEGGDFVITVKQVEAKIITQVVPNYDSIHASEEIYT